MRSERLRHSEIGVHRLTEGWGTRASVTLYLGRCQVDTPDPVVEKVWAHVRERRSRVGLVIDFGAGDGRFSRSGRYSSYVGYEIDPARCLSTDLAPNATLVHKCAFAEERSDADVCIGNPPYVRNQDLPRGWREQVSKALTQRTGVSLSGLANAWQYFFLLSLASTKPDGLVAIVVPYEWVSRPSSRALRNYIKEKNWDVIVYRLRDETFDRVLTTSSIVIVDKRKSVGRWEYFEELPRGGYHPLPSETISQSGVVAYASRSQVATAKVYAKRGLSPGTQEVLVLTEGERVRSGLRIGADVVACLTSLRPIEQNCEALTKEVFTEKFRRAGLKCWLVRTDRKPSHALAAYLASVPPDKYQTSTCLGRETWWQFSMPSVPALLSATGFCQQRQKIVDNVFGARAVGSVAGIYGVPKQHRRSFLHKLRKLNLGDRIVSHSNGLKKLEINQLNTILESVEISRR